jgi:hypothetical protein
MKQQLNEELGRYMGYVDQAWNPRSEYILNLDHISIQYITTVRNIYELHGIFWHVPLVFNGWGYMLGAVLFN